MITLFLFGFVPFIGHADHGQLFCNAACVVERQDAPPITSDGPVNMPIEGVVLRVSAR